MKTHIEVIDGETATAGTVVDIRVDTGADVTCLPADVLDRHKVKFTRRHTFIDADGSKHTRNVGYAWIRLLGRNVLTYCQRNEGSDAVLLSWHAMAQAHVTPDVGSGKWIDTADPSNLQYMEDNDG